jgi:hypothetical protein
VLYDQHHGTRETQTLLCDQDLAHLEILIHLQDQAEVEVVHRHPLEAQEAVLADHQGHLDQVAEVAQVAEDNLRL